jgi:hypothetical protein
MADSNGSGPIGTQVISRREAIMGALALAAGTLVVSQPGVALAAPSPVLTAGGMVYTSGETIVHLTPDGTSNTNIVASAIFNRFGFTSGGLVQAISGAVQPGAAAGSVGVWGKAWGSGLVGMQAEHSRANGTALQVIGRTSFSRSGLGTIPKGKSKVTIVVPTGVEATSMILATLQGSAGTGVYLRYARKLATSTTKFEVVLNKASASEVSFAWFILG